jgi:hypothetical protein
MYPENEEVEIVLTKHLEEFRFALREEIKSAKRGSYNQAIQLSSGRRISKVGKSNQYIFNLRSPMQFLGDTPGKLYIENMAPIDVTIVAVDGMSIIISSSLDKGDFIGKARLSSDLTYLLEKLIGRIEELSDTNNEVGERLLKNSP